MQSELKWFRDIHSSDFILVHSFRYFILLNLYEDLLPLSCLSSSVYVLSSLAEPSTQMKVPVPCFSPSWQRWWIMKTALSNRNVWSNYQTGRLWYMMVCASRCIDAERLNELIQGLTSAWASRRMAYANMELWTTVRQTIKYKILLRVSWFSCTLYWPLYEEPQLNSEHGEGENHFKHDPKNPKTCLTMSEPHHCSISLLTSWTIQFYQFNQLNQNCPKSCLYLCLPLSIWGSFRARTPQHSYPRVLMTSPQHL